MILARYIYAGVPICCCLRTIFQSEAIEQYCQIVDELVGSTNVEPMSDVDVTSSTDYKEITVTDDGGARTILLNRPSKYNAINYQV